MMILTIIIMLEQNKIKLIKINILMVNNEILTIILKNNGLYNYKSDNINNNNDNENENIEN